MAFLNVNGVDRPAVPRRGLARRRALVTAPRVELRGVGHAYGGRVVLAGVDLRARARPRARRCWARTAAASRRSCAASRGCCARARARCSSTAARAASCRRAERARVGLRRAPAAGLGRAERAREPAPVRRPLRPRRRDAPSARSRRADLARGGGAPGRARSPRASGSGSRSPAPSCRPRACSCSTSRTAASTRRAARRLDALLAEARGHVTLVLATHERARAERLCDELLQLEVLR